MELSLENVGEEYRRQPPFVRMMLEDVENDPGAAIPRLTTNNLYPLEAVQLLYMAIEMLEGDLSEEDKEELSEWLAGDGD